MGVSVRSRGRVVAIQVLYGLDVGQAPAHSAVSQYNDRFQMDDDPRSLHFAEELVRETWAHLEEIDGIIQEASKKWRLERMARVDLAILRLATCELCYSESVPTRVVINEAIELAKRFGAEEASAFVNGILDRVAKSLPPRPA